MYKWSFLLTAYIQRRKCSTNAFRQLRVVSTRKSYLLCCGCWEI